MKILIFILIIYCQFSYSISEEENKEWTEFQIECSLTEGCSASADIYGGLLCTCTEKFEFESEFQINNINTEDTE